MEGGRERERQVMLMVMLMLMLIVMVIVTEGETGAGGVQREGSVCMVDRTKTRRLDTTIPYIVFLILRE